MLTERSPYTPSNQRVILTTLTIIGILTPTLFWSVLEPVTYWFPIVAILGIALIRTGYPTQIPTWMVFNFFSIYFMVYAAYSFGTRLGPSLMLLLIIGILAYDIIGVQTGTMQSMATRMIRFGIPVFLLVPHSAQFNFTSFTTILKEDGLEGLHGSKHGVTMLGIGDGFLPGALAVSAGSIGIGTTVGPLSVTLPQVTVGIGGIASLALLSYLKIPKTLAALIFSAPGAVLGFAAGIGLSHLVTL